MPVSKGCLAMFAINSTIDYIDELMRARCFDIVALNGTNMKCVYSFV